MSLSRLINTSPTPALPDETEVLDLESEQAGAIIEALGSDMARRTLSTLYEEPLPASSLAERLDTSIQNVRYHLENLQEAELIKVADVQYSDAGREMKIYAPTSNAVLLLSTKSTKARIRELLSTLLATTLLLGIVAIGLRQLIVWRYGTDPELERGAYQFGADGDEEAELDTISPTAALREGEPLRELPLVLDPAIVFVLGGLLAICLVFGLSWWVHRSP